MALTVSNVGDVVTDTATGMTGKLVAVAGAVTWCQVIYNVTNSKSDFMADLADLVLASPSATALAEALEEEEMPQPPF